MERDAALSSPTDCFHLHPHLIRLTSPVAFGNLRDISAAYRFIRRWTPIKSDGDCQSISKAIHDPFYGRLRRAEVDQ